MASKKIFTQRNFLKYLIFSGIFFANAINAQKSSARIRNNIDIPKVVSYRSASCSCRKKWIDHIRNNELEVVDKIVENVSKVKNKYRMPYKLSSFHSSQLDNYTIDILAPIQLINKVLREKPIINGESVPCMPIHS